jgi:DNA-binding transcriptional ArsR family regulator
MNDNAAAYDLDATLIALADPTRRGILARLGSGDACVTELAEPFDISLNSVSKHIRMLERARLVTRAVHGREHRLSLNPAPLDAVAAWIDTHRRFWTTSLAAMDRALQQRSRAAGDRTPATRRRRR